VQQEVVSLVALGSKAVCPVAHNWHQFKGTPGVASAGIWNGTKTLFEGHAHDATI
jgi:hypothetical protein